MKVNDIDMDAVILGNGEYPTHSMPETMLIMAPYVVCCCLLYTSPSPRD